MAHALMLGARILLPGVIDEGRRLIQALQASQFEFDAAFWLFGEESERWKMIIATPLYDREGPIKAYSRFTPICDVMDPPLRIDTTDVALEGRGDRLVKALRKRFDFKHAKDDKALERDVVDREHIEAAYLYQLSEI